MSFIDNLTTGYKGYVQGVKFLFKNKLWYYFIFPAIIGIGIYFLGQYFVGLEKDINQELKENNPENLNQLIWMNIELVVSDGFYVIFTKFTKYIVIILLSPLLALLSEKIEEIMTGNVYPFNLRQLWHDVRRGAKIAVRNMLWEYFFLLVVLGVAVFFPEKNQLKAIFIFSIPMIIGFYYYGFGFLDYINERRRLNIQESTHFVRNHRGLAFAIGSVYSLLFMLPEIFRLLMPGIMSNTVVYLILTTLAITAAPIFAIAAATLSMNEIVGLDNNEWAIKKNNEITEKETAESTEITEEMDTEQTTEKE